jgi:hypothetical protein
VAFLGDFGKFFGLGSSEEVLGDVGSAVGTAFGGPVTGEKIGRSMGESLARATNQTHNQLCLLLHQGDPVI